MRARILRAFFVSAGLAAAVMTAGCQQFTGAVSHVKSDKLSVVATASVLASIAASVGGAYVHVETLVPNGASPETFEPTPREVALLHDANVLIENGAGYETWIGKVISSAANPGIRTVVLSLGLKEINENPHLWMDPVRARVYARHIRIALAAADPAHADEYAANDALYEQSLRTLQRRIYRLIKTVPKNRRGMIFAHDAWRYYNKRFGLATLGIIETAPGREPAAAHLAEIVRLARLHHVSAIFSESTESSRLAQAVADEVPGATVIPLYVDSLGDETSPVSGYREMLWYDTRKIVTALKTTPILKPKLKSSAPAVDGASSDDTNDVEDVHVEPIPTNHSGTVHLPVSDPGSDDGDLR